MGAKMLSAFDADGREITTTQRAAGEGVEPFECKGCNVGVVYVPSHPRERDGKPYSVNAYYRLRPNVEHGDNCPFDVERKLQAIASRSHGLLESLKKGRYRFRLVAVERDAEASRSSELKNGETRKRPSSSSTEFSRPAGRRLAAYLSTAKRIIQLRAECESDESIKDHLQLVFNGESVGWQDFYYEAERFLTAFQFVANTGSRFPIALLGHVRNIRPVDSRKGRFYVMNLRSSKATALLGDPTVGESGEAAVWVREPRWLERFKENDEVLVFGHWQQAPKQPPLWTPTRSSAFRSYLNRELSIWPTFRSQIGKVSDSGC